MFTSPRTQPDSTRRLARVSIAVAVALVLALPGLTAARWSFHPTIASAPGPSTPLVTGLVVHDLATGGETPASLVQELVGAGAVVSNVQHSGAAVGAGTFTGGSGIIGFERGVVLGSGDVADVVGPNNVNAGIETAFSTPGDQDLESIVGSPTWDASVLEFDLECSAADTISFQYVFTSDEYDYDISFPFNDAFACFVNGQNIALIPGTTSPVTLRTVNCDYPYDPNGGVNCGFYITNDCNSLGLGFPCANIATEMDGLTGVFTATGALQPGPNHIKLVIADHYDEGVDSNVFIRGQSFDCSSSPPMFGASSPCGQVLDALAGIPFSFAMSASSTNGLPGESVMLAVSGDAIPLAGGTFTPTLPAGPSQPVSTQFDWTPTVADVGLYHLDFTATDQMLESAVCSVTLRVDRPGLPEFTAPSPCAQVLDAYVGVPMSFGIAVSATNGFPGESVTLSVAGDPAPLAGGIFTPPLPAGPAAMVPTQFDWVPTLADVGTHSLDFTATDQLLGSTQCAVTIRVRRSPGTDLCQPGVAGVMNCPCANPPASAPRGCDNSFGTGGARLWSTGVASTGQSTLGFTTEGQSPTALSILFQGNTTLPAGITFGQGVRCAGGLIKRMYVKIAVGGSISAPQAGDPSVWSRSAQRGDFIQSGQTRLYAVYYRDNTVLGGCPAGAVFNITQTQEVLWSP
ncbi:MAG: choice-of-anchor L domain-containing protein [Planctomycetota bacterium]